MPVGVDLAEDEGGIELGHAFYIDESHQVGLGQQMQAGNGENGRGVEMTERRSIVRQGGAQRQTGWPRGVAKAIEAPQHEDTYDDDGRKSASET